LPARSRWLALVRAGLKLIADSVSGHLNYARCMLAMHDRSAVCTAARNGYYRFY